jgi:DNA-binding NarL/FixJ family response regulator
MITVDGGSWDARAVTGRRVVVVDDNAAMRMLLVMHLGVEGWDVVAEAADAEEGLTKVRELTPDAVVLDQELPLGPGTRVLPEMRVASPAARIVLFSADATNRVLAEELGADGFLLKGDPLSELTQLLSG